MSEEATFLTIKYPAMSITNHKYRLIKYLGLCFHSLFSESVSWKIYITFAIENHVL